jgi:hypothetical protein
MIALKKARMCALIGLILVGCSPLSSQVTQFPTATGLVETTLPSATVRPATPIPTPTRVSSIWVKSIDEYTNIRSGPGVNFPIIDTLSNGKVVPVTGKTYDLEWLQISIDGLSGWVYRNVVSIDGDLGSVACISTDTVACENQNLPVNYEIAIENIRFVTQKPDLQVTFRDIIQDANAGLREALVFVDGLGTEYYVDQETNQVVEFTQHQLDPSSSLKNKSLSQLREEAENLASKNSTQFASLKDSLIYSEGTKGSRFFFRWEKRNETGQPPVGIIVFQVGLDQAGRIVSYLNTLDVLK